MSTSLSKKELWQSNINDFRSSGLTAGTWCQNHNCSISTLRYWTTKFQRETISSTEETLPAFAKVDTSKLAASFSLNGSAPVTIRLGGLEISVSDNCHPELLSNLIGILHNYA